MSFFKNVLHDTVTRPNDLQIFSTEEYVIILFEIVHLAALLSITHCFLSTWYVLPPHVCLQADITLGITRAA